jgi:hypothetical protein
MMCKETFHTDAESQEEADGGEIKVRCGKQAGSKEMHGKL